MKIEELLGIDLAGYKLERWYKVFHRGKRIVRSNPNYKNIVLSPPTTTEFIEVSHGFFKTEKEAKAERNEEQERTREICHFQEVIVLTKDGSRGFLIGSNLEEVSLRRRKIK